MKLAFELSGEHKTLPKSEVISLFGDKLVYEAERVLILDVNSYDAELGKRLAMTHSIIEVAAMCEQNLNSIYNAALHMDFHKAKMSVRAKRIKSRLKSTDVERTIGEALFERGYKANLKHPEVTVRAILTNDVCVFGTLLTLIEGGSFELRRPHLKPFFYPGVLLPRTARAAINLTGIKTGEVLLDPFCGTGGILIEAGLVGVKVLGSDAQRMMVCGTQMNMDYYGIDNTLLIQDAQQLGLTDECMDSVVTDLPYGRSARIKAHSHSQLRSKAINEIFRVLKKGRRAVIISDDPIDADVVDAGFLIEESHTQYVHKSLTRRIVVLRK